MGIEEKRRLRTEFMRWLYEKTDGDQWIPVSANEFRQDTRFGSPDEATVRGVIQYLEGEMLVKPHWVLGGLPSVNITHYGLREMEEALQAPNEPTEHFAPINVLHVYGNVVGSNIQQGTNRSSQAVTNSQSEKADMTAFLAAVREALSDTRFNESLRPKVETDVALIEAEASKPAPDWKLLRVLGQSLRAIVESGLGGVLTSALAATAWPVAA